MIAPGVQPYSDHPKKEQNDRLREQVDFPWRGELADVVEIQGCAGLLHENSLGGVNTSRMHSADYGAGCRALLP